MDRGTMMSADESGRGRDVLPDGAWGGAALLSAAAVLVSAASQAYVRISRVHLEWWLARRPPLQMGVPEDLCAVSVILRESAEGEQRQPSVP